MSDETETKPKSDPPKEFAAIFYAAGAWLLALPWGWKTASVAFVVVFVSLMAFFIYASVSELRDERKAARDAGAGR